MCASIEKIGVAIEKIGVATGKGFNLWKILK